MTMQELFEKRGYIVFGWVHAGAVGSVWKPGTVTMMIPDMNEVEIKIVAETDRDDWLEQARLLKLANRSTPWPFYYRGVAE